MPQTQIITQVRASSGGGGRRPTPLPSHCPSPWQPLHCHTLASCAPRGTLSKCGRSGSWESCTCYRSKHSRPLSSSAWYYALPSCHLPNVPWMAHVASRLVPPEQGPVHSLPGSGLSVGNCHRTGQHCHRPGKWWHREPDSAFRTPLTQWKRSAAGTQHRRGALCHHTDDVRGLVHPKVLDLLRKLAPYHCSIQAETL